MKTRLLPLLLLALTASAQAQITKYIWTGTTSNNWSTASNWSGGTMPTSNSPLFSSAGANQTIDITAAATAMKAPYFYGGSYTFGNQTLLMGSGTGPSQLGSGTITFNSGLTIGGNILFQGTGSGDIFLNGVSGNSTAGGSFSVQKYNTSNLTITNTFTSNSTGAQILRAGALILSGNGVFNLSNATNTISLGGNSYYLSGVIADSSGAALILDNTGTNLGDRVTDANRINFGQRGLIELRGNASAASSETLGVINADGAGTRIRVSSGAGQSAQLTFASLLVDGAANQANTASNPTIIQFLVPSGNTLGAGDGTGGRVIFTAAPTLTDGVLRYGIVKDESVGGGATFATYNGTNGVQAFSAWTDTNLNNSTSTASINASGNITLAASKETTALRITATADNQSLNLGSYNLTLNGTTNGFIFNGSGNYSITGGGAQGFNVLGNAAYLYVNSNTLTISANFTKNNSTGDLTKAGDGLLVISGNYSHQNNYFLGVDKGSNGGDDMQISGKISGTQNLVKTGMGALALTGSGNNTAYGAGFQITAGTLVIAKDTQELQNTALGTGPLTLNGGAFAARNFAATLSNAIGLGNGVNVANEIKSDMPITFLGAVRGGTFTGQTYILVNNSTANVTINGNVSAWSSPYTGNLSTSTIEFSGSGTTIISGIVENVGNGTTALKKEGTGLLTLSGCNTYTGSTKVWGGYLRLDNASALSGDLLELASQAYSGFADAVVELGVGNTNFTRVSGNATGNVDIGGAGAGFNTAGFASVTGTAIVNLGGAGAALSWGSTGFFKSGGSLVLGSPNVAGTVDFQNGLGLGGNRTIIALNGSADVDGIVSGNITGSASNLTKEGNGTLALTAANTYTGATVVSAGTLQIGNGGTTGSLATGSAIINNGTLAFKRSDAISQGTHFNNVISGTGTLIQAGSGNLTLNGVNTYTGKTIISAGTLLLGASGTIANSSEINLGTLASQGRLDLTAKSSFTFGAGQTVSGYGTIDIGLGKTVTVAGNLAPGNSPGILSVVGNLALTGTTTMEINGATTAGVDYDQVSLSGSLSNGGNLVLSFGTAFSGGPITLFSAGGGYSGTFAGVTGTGHYGALTFNPSGNVWTSGDLSFDQSTGVLTAVPEPSTWLLLALAGTLGLVLRFPRLFKRIKSLGVSSILLATSLFCQRAMAELNWMAPNKVDADTLILYHMDEKGLTLKDSGPNMLDGTLGNESSRSTEPPTWLIPPAGGFLIPTSTTGMVGDVRVRDVDFGKGLTISMWYRSQPDEEHGGEIFQIEGPRVRVVTDNFGVRNNGRLVMLAPGEKVDGKSAIVDFGPENEWRHIAVVYDPVNATAEDGGTWSLYLDGELVGSTEDKTDLSAKPSFSLRVGGNVFNNGYLQGGCIDEFLISNRVITDFSRPAGN